MTTVDFITDLFCRVDEVMKDIPKHPQAHLCPSEVVTLSLLFVLKGGGERAFYRWLTRDYRPLFPRLAARTRLFRLFATHQDWAARFLAEPTILAVALTQPDHAELAAASHALGARASPPTAGSSAASSAWSSTSGAWCAPGARTPLTPTTALSTRSSPAAPRAWSSSPIRRSGARRATRPT